MDYNDVLMHHYASSDFLCHHGILGQKWGIRRFQNEDGSLTAAGRKRYYNNGYTLTKKGHKEFIGKDGKFTESGSLATKHLTGYSDEEKMLWLTDRHALNEKLKKEVDFRHIKDKAEKEKKETELLNLWNDTDWDNLTAKQQDLCLALGARITQESGNWYESTGVSSGFKKYISDTRTIRDAIDKRKAEIRAANPVGDYPDERKYLSYNKFKKDMDAYMEKRNAVHELIKNDDKIKRLDSKCVDIVSELPGVVLRDLGWEDTEEHRRKIAPMIFVD